MSSSDVQQVDIWFKATIGREDSGCIRGVELGSNGGFVLGSLVQAFQPLLASASGEW